VCLKASLSQFLSLLLSSSLSLYSSLDPQFPIESFRFVSPFFSISSFPNFFYLICFLSFKCSAITATRICYLLLNYGFYNFHLRISVCTCNNLISIFFLLHPIWVHEASFSELNRASWFLCCCRKIYALLRFHLNVLLGDMGLWCCCVFCLCNYLFIGPLCVFVLFLRP